MHIDLTATGFLSDATTAFLKKDDAMMALFPASHPYHSIEKAIEGKQHFPREKRQVLYEVLRDQYAQIGLGNDPVIKRQTEALLSADTYTVTTGQQLHLLMGPAFMVYKLLSVVKAAEALALQYPGKKFIPVFWLASEDHDFEEIKNTPVFGRQYPWETSQTGPCGEFHLNDISSVFKPLYEKFAADEKTTALLKGYEAIYNSSATLSEATRKLTHQLFGALGLICIEPNDRRLKSLFKEIVKQELTEQKSFALFNEFSDSMKAAGYHQQLKPRPINLFYLEKGSRNRITFENNQYSISGTDRVLSREDILAETEAFPERFSPNAVLRPIYQETLLPNVAYIGGNAEISYWLQLKPIFELYNTTPAAIALRQSVWMMRQKQAKWLENKHITINEMFGANDRKALSLLLSEEKESNPLNLILTNFTEIKKTIQDNIAQQQLSQLKPLVELGKQYEKALKEALAEAESNKAAGLGDDLKKLEQLKRDYFDPNAIQERVIYAIEYLITVPDYINFCSKTMVFKPGTGFFLFY